MAGLDHELESVIIDLSDTSLDQLSALDDEALSAVTACGDANRDGSAAFWSDDSRSPE
ncbi:hypothetical protein ACFQ07_08265 [Actinomadura adrarensis]|uniref:FXSXX-COOH protein n=1 Tax=Actinomadura adrarensis TaxID=1819600 RepID=A0ABW3CF84_9ACTN